ncbi:TIGR00730 family Rossman fold protein [Marinococcus halophilus]|uniref:Cytokinin riboside 5'-monophosphate phosphoribohydrolase n=1 Tax=Marinococcus halophilus TaxID=1371 RepID=A0A510Y9B5_MARHA|nr:TIGR00730 family Rossman fold protein [Marinococcus halophilus]OZT79204.1 TIGR00730 family Rossman fold protein [Marinococcus halophilus]GEK59763.1 cytokinin riboside 5'-monophosphate phosphoribohydrolase [Marinococcus halophilus]
MKSIAVFCGSRLGRDPVYKDSAEALGREIASSGCVLVYGGSDAGTMGRLADAALEAGGEVIGVIPDKLIEREIAHPSLSKLYTVSTMHERKARMAELADGFIALPGGPGTLEEFFEMFTWAQIGLHHKPCALLNIHHYYDHLLQFFNHMEQEQFLPADHRDKVIVSSSPKELLQQLCESAGAEKKSYE